MKKVLIFALLLFLSIAVFAGSSGKGTVTTDSTAYQYKALVELQGIERLGIILKNTGDMTSYYDLRLYPSEDFEDYIYMALADATGDSLFYSDGAFTETGIVGEPVYNVSDGSSGTITAINDSTVYATLAGGTNNSWTAGDLYKIRRPLLYYSITDSLASGSQFEAEIVNYYSQVKLFIKKASASDSTATYNYQFRKQE